MRSFSPNCVFFCGLFVFLLGSLRLWGQDAGGSTDLALRVVTTVEERFSAGLLDRGAAGERYQVLRAAAKTQDLRDVRHLVFEWLSLIPVSHLGLLSTSTHEILQAELAGEPHVTLGFQVVEDRGAYFVADLYEEGTAELAGLRMNDQILKIDGIPIEVSPRLDFRSDDAALPDLPRHHLLVQNGETVSLTVAPRVGEVVELRLRAGLDSAAAADRRGAGVFQRAGVNVGYIPLSYMYDDESVTLVRESLAAFGAATDVLILDLRGRGGSPGAAAKIRRLFSGRRAIWNKPMLCVIDRNTRSAKEVLAFDLRRDLGVPLVGERTAGAVRPCTFLNVGSDTYLMLPVGNGRHDPYTTEIENIGVSPDVQVASAPRYSRGADPILETALGITLLHWSRASARTAEIP